MSIEQPDKVDFISVDPASGDVRLTISDHLDWRDPLNHLFLLQEKVNAYLRFCESGEIYSAYPKALNRNIAFEIAPLHPISAQGAAFIERLRDLVVRAGFDLRIAYVEHSEYESGDAEDTVLD